jgi:hypothetical protein
MRDENAIADDGHGRVGNDRQIAAPGT